MNKNFPLKYFLYFVLIFIVFSVCGVILGSIIKSGIEYRHEFFETNCTIIDRTIVQVQNCWSAYANVEFLNRNNSIQNNQLELYKCETEEYINDKLESNFLVNTTITCYYNEKYDNLIIKLSNYYIYNTIAYTFILIPFIVVSIFPLVLGIINDCECSKLSAKENDVELTTITV